MEPVVFGRFGRQSNRQEKYLVEFRLGGYSKKALRGFRDEIEVRFGAKFRHRMVPHVIIAGPLYTDDVNRLLSEVRSVAEQYAPPGVKLGGFATSPNRSVYVNVRPSEDLVSMREVIVDRLGKFCNMDERDYAKYDPHVTLCTSANFPRLYSEDTNRTFGEIVKFLGKSSTFEASSYVLRVTILGRNNRIVGEYDLLLKRMLNKQEALDRHIYKETIRALSKYEKYLVDTAGEQAVNFENDHTESLGGKDKGSGNLLKYPIRFQIHQEDQKLLVNDKGSDNAREILVRLEDLQGQFQKAYDSICDSMNSMRIDGVLAPVPNSQEPFSLEPLAWEMQHAFYMMNAKIPPDTLQPHFDVEWLKKSAKLRNSINKAISDYVLGAYSVRFVGIFSEVCVYFSPDSYGNTTIEKNAIPIFERIVGLPLYTIQLMGREVVLTFQYPPAEYGITGAPFR